MGEPFRSDAAQSGPDAHDATRIRRRRHDRPTKSRSSSRSRLRQVFFAVAAVWGFLTGVSAILVGLAAAGRPAAGGTVLWLTILASLVVAVLGGMMAARAYRDVVSRR